MMINFDGTVNVNEVVRGIGIVARDRNGMVVGTLQSCVKDIIDPASIESLAAVKALTFAKDMGFRQIILESDALAVINKINHASPDLSMIGNIIEEARVRIQIL